VYEPNKNVMLLL